MEHIAVHSLLRQWTVFPDLLTAFFFFFSFFQVRSVGRRARDAAPGRDASSRVHPELLS